MHSIKMYFDAFTIYLIYKLEEMTILFTPKFLHFFFIYFKSKEAKPVEIL